ncbi:unnamed protein product [Diamesa serratosioi]
MTELPNEFYQQTLKDIIKEKCNFADSDYKINIEAGSAKGDNYIGVLYRVTVTNEKDEFNVIVKLPPANLARREQFFARPCFLRESQFYDDLYPMFKKFQEDKGIVVKNDGFYEVAECYKSLTDDQNEGLFLEDVKVTNFLMFDRFQDATFAHVSIVMKALGKYHAISLAMKDQNPELIAPYKDLEDILMQREGDIPMTSWFDMLKVQALETLKEEKNPDIVERTKKVIDQDFFHLVKSCIDGKAAEPYSVVAHGDCWNNNIMFRYENDVPVEIRFLDWQLLRYSSPVCDLLYYIFGCTTKEFRDQYYQQSLNVYYNSVESYIKRLGSDPEKVFPRSAFDEHLMRFGKFGLAMAVMVLPVFTSNAADLPDMDEMAEIYQSGEEIDMTEFDFTSSKTIDVYNKRMLGVIHDMYNLGYI